MIGFLIIGHNHFGSGILSAAEMIIGKQKNIEYIDFLPDFDTALLDEAINQTLEKLNYSEGIIIFTDLIGGSPFNRSMVVFTEKPEYNIHVLSGTNLPILIEALNLRERINNPEILVKQILKIGKDNIIYGNEILKNEIENKC
ncbi:PTS sugar transporter subunit IIA [Thermoanaerobacterium thermosaccharolyticum]|uniref:PTS sugar transporter subunit IIA n=1 Tax=Thermoanaerobacterium thermosaccharolyticum TaxID=1517 RepID=UPI003D2DD544